MSIDCAQTVVVVWSKKIFETVSVPVFGSFGLVGNILAIMMLNKALRPTTFNQSLKALAI